MASLLLLGRPLSLPVADHDGDDGEVDGLIVVDGGELVMVLLIMRRWRRSLGHHQNKFISSPL